MAMTTEGQSWAHALDVRSDVLAVWRKLFHSDPALRRIAEIFQISVILDANVVIAELIWLSRTRTRSDARTHLQEVITAGTVVATAPRHLAREVESKLPEIGERENIPVDALMIAWSNYKSLIHFEDDVPIPAGLVEHIPDPKDLPYLLLQQRVKSVIYTRDGHFASMGAATIDVHVIGRLRDYSRHAAVEWTFASGFCVVSGITLATVVAVAKLIEPAFRGFTRLPAAAQVLFLALFIAAILHPKTRAMLKSGLGSLGESLRPALAKALEVTSPAMLAYGEAKLAADAALNDVKGRIPHVDG